jgi:hypothetical protein
MKKSLLLTISAFALCTNVFADCRQSYADLKTQNTEGLQISALTLGAASSTLGTIAIFAPNPSLVAPMISLTLAGVGGTVGMTRSGASWSSIELSNMMAIPEIVNEAELGDGQILRTMLAKMLEMKIIPVNTTTIQLADKIIEINESDACTKLIDANADIFWDYQILGNNKRLDTYSEFFYKIAKELSK